MAKTKKVKALDQLLTGFADKGVKRAKGKKPHHTGKVEIDVTGKGQIVEFDPEDAYKLLRAKSYAENREAAAEAAEESAQIKTAAAEAAAQVRDQDRADAKRLRAEAEAAIGTREEKAKGELAREAEKRAEISQIKFQTLDDDAAGARNLAKHRRDQADSAISKLEEIEVETRAEERQKIIDQAIEEAEAHAALVLKEQRADKIIDNLEQYTAAYQKAMLDRAEATKNLTLAKSELAEAKRNARLPGANSVEAEAKIKAAEENVTKAQEAHKAIVAVYLKENGNKNSWRRNAREFLDDNSDLDSKKLDSMRRALEEADNAAEAVASAKGQHQVPYTAARLRAKAAESDQAGLELAVARKAKDKADAALKEAEKTGEGIDLAKAQAEEAEANFQRATGVYESKRGNARIWKERAEALLKTTDDDVEREILESAIQQAIPKASLSERILEAAADHDAAFRRLTEAQAKWRKAMQETNAIDDPELIKATQELQEAKDNLDTSFSRTSALTQGIPNTLKDPNLSEGDREVLESALGAVKAVEKEHEMVHALDKTAEYHALREVSLRAREEASQKLEAAKDKVELTKASGEDITVAQAEVETAQKAYDKANEEFVSNSAKYNRWQSRYEKMLPPEQLSEIKVNEEAVQVVAKLEEAYVKRNELVAQLDAAYAAKKLANARVQELELANDQVNLPVARAEAAATTAALEDIKQSTGHNYENLLKLEQKANALLKGTDQGLADSNRIRLQNVLTKPSPGEHNPANITDCLNSAVILQDVRYDAVARAQKEMQEARAYLQMAKTEGSEDAIREAQIDFEKARQALDEAEDEVFSSATGVARWELEANQLLQKSDLPDSDRQILQTALDEAQQLRAKREPDFIRNNLTEKHAQRQETLEALVEARRARDTARERLNQNPESVTEKENFARAQAAYESAKRAHNAKSAVHQNWVKKAVVLGVITATLTNPDTAAASTDKTEGLGHDTETDKKAREISELRAFVEANNPEWQEAKQEYEKAKQAVFPYGTDNDEALGYLNKASIQEVEALNRATIRLEKVEDSVAAQTQALINARATARKEAEQKQATSDPLMVVRYNEASLRKAKEEFATIPVKARDLLARKKSNLRRIEETKTILREVETDEKTLEAMRRGAASLSISPEEIAHSQQANQERLNAARSELEQAEVEQKEIAVREAQLTSPGITLEELAAKEEIQSRVQEAKVVAAKIAADKSKDFYLTERVRLRREDPEIGLGEWAKEALAHREKREKAPYVKTSAWSKFWREYKENLGISSDKEEVEFPEGYDAKTHVFKSIEGIPSNGLDYNTLLKVAANYEKSGLGEALPIEYRELLAVAYNFKAAQEESDDIELDQMASNKLQGPVIVIPNQKSEPQSEISEVKMAETPKTLDAKKTKEKVWQKLAQEEPTPAAQNYTPNVWESPDINYSGEEHEQAVSIEESIEQRLSLNL